jgi:hypothetical protein
MRLRFLLHTKSSVFCGGGKTEREKTRKSSREKWKTVKAIWRFKDARHPRHHQTCFSMFAAFNKRQTARLFSFRFRFILALSQWSAENKRIFPATGWRERGKERKSQCNAIEQSSNDVTSHSFVATRCGGFSSSTASYRFEDFPRSFRIVWQRVREAGG